MIEEKETGKGETIEMRENGEKKEDLRKGTPQTLLETITPIAIPMEMKFQELQIQQAIRRESELQLSLLPVFGAWVLVIL